MEFTARSSHIYAIAPVGGLRLLVSYQLEGASVGQVLSSQTFEMIIDVLGQCHHAGSSDVPWFTRTTGCPESSARERKCSRTSLAFMPYSYVQHLIIKRIFKVLISFLPHSGQNNPYYASGFIQTETWLPPARFAGPTGVCYVPHDLR